MFSVVSAHAGSKAEVKIINKSMWEIHELYISSTDTREWGPDQLGREIIGSEGGRFTLTDIPCDAYDVRLVDEDGDVCVVNDVGLCASKGTWVIDDETLLGCQLGTDED